MKCDVLLVRVKACSQANERNWIQKDRLMK